MTSLQDLRQRRQSIQSSQKLTSAMKMVASAKLGKFQKQWILAKSHRHFLETSLRMAAKDLDPSNFPLLNQKPRKSCSQALIIILGADRGLCGGFNSQLIRFFKSERGQLREQKKEVLAIGCGNRIGEFLEKTGVTTLEKSPMGGRPNGAQARHILDKARLLFLGQKIDTCTLIYTQFINAMSQKVVAYPLLPLRAPFEAEGNFPAEWPLLEPTAPLLCEALCEMTLESVLYQAMVESCLSEEGARMTAMENATRNGQDVLKKLNLLYNRKRQNLITNELLEVIAGAGA